MAMNVFDKLTLKDQPEILVLNAPESFEPELKQLTGVSVRRKLSKSPVAFSLAFVTKQGEVDTLGPAIAKAAEGDAIVWFAYPKGSSKRYKSEINRDSGWKVFGRAGFEPVRMVAIDEDWSAVRFRRAEYIKTMTRDSAWAMSAAGKAKTARNAAKRR